MNLKEYSALVSPKRIGRQEMAPVPVVDQWWVGGSFTEQLKGGGPTAFLGCALKSTLLLSNSLNNTLEVSFRKRKGVVLRALKVGFSVRHNR